MKNYLSSFLCLSLLASCTHVEIKDSEWCADKGYLGAKCFNSLSSNTRKIAKREWDEERFGILCTKSENFTNWKSAIEKFCYQTKACTYEVKETIKELETKIEKATGKKGKIK